MKKVGQKGLLGAGAKLPSSTADPTQRTARQGFNRVPGAHEAMMVAMFIIVIIVGSSTAATASEAAATGMAITSVVRWSAAE